MAKKKYEEANIQAIAETIREKTGTENTYDTSEMASGVGEVYKAGKQKEWSDFWDNYHKNIEVNGGAQYTFAGLGWTDETFKPSRDIKPKGNAGNMFRTCGITDFETTMVNRGLNLDFSQCTHFGYGFYNSEFKSIPFDLDFRSILDNNTGVLQSVFISATSLVTIKKIILSTSGNQIFNATFGSGLTKLQNITFEGVIGQNISFSYSPLTIESMKNIISHLKNYTGTDSEGTYTLTLKDECKTALQADTETVELDGAIYTYFELITAKGWNLA